MIRGDELFGLDVLGVESPVGLFARAEDKMDTGEDAPSRLVQSILDAGFEAVANVGSKEMGFTTYSDFHGRFLVVGPGEVLWCLDTPGAYAEWLLKFTPLIRACVAHGTHEVQVGCLGGLMEFLEEQYRERETEPATDTEPTDTEPGARVPAATMADVDLKIQLRNGDLGGETDMDRLGRVLRRAAHKLGVHVASITYYTGAVPDPRETVRSRSGRNPHTRRNDERRDHD